jgi:hypothetical protein
MPGKGKSPQGEPPCPSSSAMPASARPTSPSTASSTSSTLTAASASSPKPPPASAAPTGRSGTPASATSALATPSSSWSCPGSAATPANLGRLLDRLDEQRIGLRILNLGIDTTTPAGRLIFTIIGAVAAMERELLIERTQSGLAAARTRGRVGGRRRAFTPAQEREAQRLYETRQMTMDQIAKAVGSSSSTVYRYLRVEG